MIDEYWKSTQKRKIRHGREACQDRTQRLFQWPKPRIEMPPVVHAVPENGTPHLLRAGGAHRPLVLIEPQALFLERKRAVVKEPANLGFGVLDHRLVEYAMNPARQRRIEVGHQVNVVTVVSAEVLKIVRKVLTAGE